MQTQRSRDQFGRSIEYLRISVTDRCNFRCVYCMPEEGLPWLPKSDILSYEEIADVVRQLAPLGLAPAAHHRRRADDSPADPRADSHAARDSGDRGHRALDERRAAAGDRADAARVRASIA